MNCKFVNEENFMDAVEALYTWLILNHEGQGSEKYELQCRMNYNPGMGFSESRVEAENYFYGEINEDNYLQIFEEIMLFMEEEQKNGND